MTHLFAYDAAMVTDDEQTPRITTPLGDVEPRVVAGTLDTRASKCRAHIISHDRHVSSWSCDEVTIEILTSRLPQNPDAPGVTETWAVIIRLVSTVDVSALDYGLNWIDPTDLPEAGIDCGQYRYARVWSTDHIRLVIGTDDDQALQLRSIAMDLVPASWAPIIEDWRTFNLYAVLDNNGVTFRAPAVPAGQIVQLHFAIAWTDDLENGWAATLATDLSDDQLTALINGLAADA